METNLLDSGTSVGANYRSACKGRSKAEFIAKLGIVEEEADETAYWLELIIEGGLLEKGVVEPLLKEANEIVAIMASSRKSASGEEKFTICDWRMTILLNVIWNCEVRFVRQIANCKSKMRGVLCSRF